MSRCFPYPPPGYCRNGAAHEALIESIKLQKETDKAKAERRKEKKAKKEKKEKKKEEKEKRKIDEKLKLQKNQSQDSHKLLQKEAGFTEAQINGKKPNTEVLEKSDLTEENGQPIKPCYSSDSTQNSNKRRRDDDDNDNDDLLPDDSTGHGKHIKIRLLKKLKGSDSSNSGEGARSKTVPLAPSSSLDRTLRVSSNGNDGIPATSGRYNNAAQGIPLTQTKSNGLHLSREQSVSGSSAKPILPPVSRKTDVEVVKSSRQQQQQQQQKHQQIANFVRPVVAQSQLKHERPSPSVSRNTGVQGLNSVRHQQGPSNLKPVIPGPSNLKPRIPGPVLNKPNSIATEKRPINEIPVPGTSGKRPINEIPVPSTSGPTKLGKRKEEPQKVGPTRSEKKMMKKMMKKMAKYEKVIGSWVPPVLQAILPDVVDGEEDWLSRRTKPASSSISKGEVESCAELPASSLWQPRARFLAEADIHALPYTVPF